MNKNILILLIISSLNLFAFSDYDMDGVEDKSDKCPNTSFSELVDINGCTTESLASPHHFDIIFGMDYAETNYATLEKSDTITKTLQLDYYYDDFSLQAIVSHYNSTSTTSKNSGINDSFLGAYYSIKPDDKLTVRLGGGIIVPTYDDELNNNNTDYTASLNLSYMLDNVNLFGGYGYTIVTDDDISNSVTYQNTNSYSIGIGFYPKEKLYVSASYNSSDSIYVGVDKINTASIYAFYTIDENWFSNFSYARGLSDTASDNSISFKLGYYF